MMMSYPDKSHIQALWDSNHALYLSVYLPVSLFDLANCSTQQKVCCWRYYDRLNDRWWWWWWGRVSTSEWGCLCGVTITADTVTCIISINNFIISLPVSSAQGSTNCAAVYLYSCSGERLHRLWLFCFRDKTWKPLGNRQTNDTCSASAAC